MQTNISVQYKDSAYGKEADRILRSCVHCGFCTATCPTYQLLGDELDGPRGRIYLIKQVLEGNAATNKTMTHLDRCLTCRSCETTCPSGVEYARLIDIGRYIVEAEAKRPWTDKLKRNLLHWVLVNPQRFRKVYRLAESFNRFLPANLKVQHQTSIIEDLPSTRHDNYVIMLEGCVQPVLAPNINIATRKVLDRIGYSTLVVKQTECCGAISHHLNKHETAREIMRRNIDAWWPHISNGCKAIIANASGCGVMLKDYAKLLADDPQYANKARLLSERVRDISEIIQRQDTNKLALKKRRKVAFHAPCTLQHGLQLNTRVENLLQSLGFDLVDVQDSHLCCGSAGTYSLLQPVIANRLKQNKLHNLQRHQPELIITANIGCQHHLQTGTNTPVRHWVEIIAEAIK